MQGTWNKIKRFTAVLANVSFFILQIMQELRFEIPKQCHLLRVSVPTGTVLLRFDFQILQNLPAKLHANGGVYGTLPMRI